MNYEQMLSFVKNELPKLRGKWARISREGKVNDRDLHRIMKGETQNPRIDTLRRIMAGVKAIQ